MRRLFKFLSVFIVAIFVLQVFAPGITGMAALALVDGNVPKSASKGTIISSEGDATLSEDLLSSDKYVTDRDVTSGEETAILGEVEDLRTEYAKHYRHVDGTYTAMLHSEPVHYKDKSGTWQDIDNTLILSSSKKSVTGKATYTLTASDVDICIPQDFGNNQKLTIEKDGFIIQMGIKTATLDNVISTKPITVDRLSQVKAEVNNNYTDNEKDTLSSILNAEKLTVSEQNNMKMKLDTRTSAVRYNDIFTDTDLEYVITSNKIKESIIVNNRQEEYVYQFVMDLAGLNPVPQENGSIHLMKDVKDEEPVFIIEAPYMYDAKKETNYGVTMTIENNVLTVTADKDWINADGRDFPVTIDPTITIKNSSFYDADVGEISNNTNFGNNDTIIVGKGITYMRRAYIKFNLPQLPDGSIITNASLRLVQKDLDYDKDNRQIYVIDLTEKNSWYESTVTWANQPVSTEKNGPHNDSTTKKLDFQEVAPGYDLAYNFDITKAVKYWYEGYNNGRSTNNGIMLTNNDETKMCCAHFYSSEATNEANRPSVTIKYNCNLGLEDYWSYETLDLDNSGVLYVNDYNGVLTYVHNDISMTGNLLPINISHVYNSADKGIYSTYYSGMNVGNKFHLNIQELLIPITSNDSMYNDGYRYKYYDGDGTIHYFRKASENSPIICYEFDPNIVITQSGSDRIITDADGNKRYFSNNRLYKLEDKDGNTQVFTFSGNKITEVTDPVGRKATLVYDDESGQLVSIKDPANRVISYSYTESDQLTTITYSDNKKTQLVYGMDESITFSAYNGLSAKVEFIKTYACGKRVGKLYKYDKNDSQIDCLTFEYTQNDESGYTMGNTKVSNSYDNYNTYLFDAYGRTTSVINQDGQSAFSVYESEASTSPYLFNKVTDSSDLLTIANNLVYNHGFEGNGYWAALQGSVSDACTYSLAESMHGSRSLKLQLTNDAETAEIGQDFTAQVGENYTISVYVNIPQALELTGNNGVAFGFMYRVNGEWISESSDWIGSTSGWERFSHIITMPQGADIQECRVFLKLAKTAGTVYFDSVQVEKSGGARMYNLVENSDFSSAPVNPGTNLAEGTQPDVWTVTNGEEYDGVYFYDRINANEMRMVGNPTKQKSVSQLVPVGASEGDILIIGGKAAAYATYDQANERKFGIKATLYNRDPNVFIGSANVIDTVEIEFDRTINMEHQTRARRIELEEDCGYILFEFVFYYHIDCVAFNNGFIYVGSFGEHYEYDENTGNLTSENNDEGTIKEYAYNANGDLTEVAQTVSGVEKTVATYTYDNNGDVSTITNNEGTVISYEKIYDSNGNLTAVETVQTDSETNSEKLIEKVTYLQNGNYVNSVTDLTGGTTTYTYDGDNNNISLGTVTQIQDPNGNVRKITYTGHRQAMKSTIAQNNGSNSGAVVGFRYTSDGLLGMMSRGGVTYNFDYDSQNRVVSADVSNNQIWSKTYDSKGRLATMTYVTDFVYSPIYDSRDRVVGDKWNSTQTSEYYYNDNDRLSKYVDLTTDVSYQYDYAFYGLLHRIDSSDGYRTEYDYDMSGKLSHLTFSNNGDKIYSARYVTNEKGYPEDVVIETMNSALLHYNYDSAGNLTSKSAGPVISTVTYLQTDDGLTADLIQQYTNEDLDGNILQNYVYTYDANGNITSITETVSNSTTTYVYDEIDRLVSETVNGDTLQYNYDANGNILSVTKNGETVHTNTYYTTTRKDVLIAVNGVSVGYTDYGLPSTYNGYTFTWQRNNQLAGFSGNGTNITYIYDAQGKRIRQVVNGLTLDYIYSGDILMRQTDGTNILDFVYDASGIMIGFKYNGTPYFYVKNPQGDIVAVIDADGNNVANYTYDAYGNILSYSGAMASINPIRYRGYYQDPETGWYYLKTRYYNPDWRRFISMDSTFVAGDDIINGSNMFAYCNNNPVRYVDSEGTEATEWEEAAGIIHKISSTLVNTFGGLTNNLLSGASNALLDVVKNWLGDQDDFAGTHIEQNHFTPLLNFGAYWLLPLLDIEALGLDEIFKPLTGLRHFMPIDMSFGAPWAGYFLSFEKNTYNELDIYTSPKSYMWQSQVGYTPIYDFFFSCGGPIFREKYTFEREVESILFPKEYYVVWIWKGDYWNLGAGAEIGIYRTRLKFHADKEFYHVVEDLTLDVEMNINYPLNGGVSTSVGYLKQTNWWICCFIPDIQVPDIKDLNVELKVRFTDPTLAKPFYDEWKARDDTPQTDDNWSKINNMMLPPYNYTDNSNFYQFQIHY